MDVARRVEIKDWQKPENGWHEGQNKVSGSWSAGGLVKFGGSGAATKDGGAVVQLELGLRGPHDNDYIIVSRSRLTGHGDTMSARVEAALYLPAVKYDYVIRWVSDRSMQTHTLAELTPTSISDASLINLYVFSNGGPVWTAVTPSLSVKVNVRGRAAGSLAKGWMKIVLSAPGKQTIYRTPEKQQWQDEDDAVGGGFATAEGPIPGVIVTSAGSSQLLGSSFSASVLNFNADSSELELFITGAP